MSGEVGSNNSDIFPTLHEVLHGKPDPRAAHFDEALVHLKVADSRVWLVTLEGMAGDIGIALRSQEGTRAATKWWLDQIAEATRPRFRIRVKSGHKGTSNGSGWGLRGPGSRSMSRTYWPKRRMCSHM